MIKYSSYFYIWGLSLNFYYYQALKFQELLSQKRFQYISCVGSILLDGRFRRRRVISIHLMCRFDSIWSQATQTSLAISIHLMCRFDRKERILCRAWYRFQYISCVGSIFHQPQLQTLFMRFQYISCVGSILSASIVHHRLTRFQYISCVGSILCALWLCRQKHLISIHLMCRFD